VSKPILEWTDEEGALRSINVIDRVFIGRSCKGIDKAKRIIVGDPQVSREHAMITWSGVALLVEDMSKNGTWVNDVRLTAGASRALVHNDVIRVGHRLIRVMWPEAVDAKTEEEFDTAATRIEPVGMTITSLVADMRGFTAMTQKEQSSSVYALLKALFDTLSTIIYECKGTIVDYAGDAVFAFWDHSLFEGKEQAFRACEAAVKHRGEIRKMRSSDASQAFPALETLRMGWGITTGRVTMAHYGARAADLALVGDSTNLAFRLSGMANKTLPHGVLLCSKTADLIRERFALVDLGFVPIRGRSGEEHLFSIEQLL
jgi:class 3 adenylate cyclase